MNIKIDCFCGTRFAFDIDPTNGQMPVVVNCPACGADGTAAANRAIQQSLSSQSAAPVRITPPTTAPPIDPQVRLEKRIVRIGVVLIAVLLLFAGWKIWYQLWGNKPRVVFSLDVTPNQTTPAAKLISPSEAFVFNGREALLYDIFKGVKIWAKVTENADKSLPSAENPNEPSAPLIQVTTDSIWVAQPQRVLQFNRKTGSPKDLPFPTPASRLLASEQAIFAISETGPSGGSITRVDLMDGTVQTESMALKPGQKSAAIPASGSITRAPATKADLDRIDWLVSGPNILAISVKCLEARIVTREAKKPGAGVGLDSSSLTAGKSMEASAEMMNDMSREGGGNIEYEDQSRYRITMRTAFGGAESDGTDEVIGNPAFFPLQTVNIICAGRKVLVYDKQYKKLWESERGYLISKKAMPGYRPERPSGKISLEQTDFNPQPIIPCLEDSGALFFFDQGVLTAFDLSSGKVKWHLNSVGISKIAADRQGKLYVATTSATPESLQHAKEIRIEKSVIPILLKVDAATGKILWRVEQTGQDCFLSGHFIFATHARIPFMEAIEAVTDDKDPSVNFTVTRIRPEDGQMLRDFFRRKLPVKIDIVQNSILLQFLNRMEFVYFPI